MFLFLSIACIQGNKIEKSKSKKGKITFQKLKETVNKNGLPEYHIYIENITNDNLDENDALINIIISKIYKDYKTETPNMTMYLYFDKEAAENMIRILSVVILEIKFHKLEAAHLGGQRVLTKDEYRIFKAFTIFNTDNKFNSEKEVFEAGAVNFNMEPNKYREMILGIMTKVIKNSRGVLN